MLLDQSTPAVVTGGASGLGEATARALAGYGAPVTIFDLDADRGQSVAAEIGGRFQSVDVSDAKVVADAFAEARAAQGQERILVNCAGIAPGAKTTSKGAPHDPGLFAKVIAINLLGSFHCASVAATGMAAAGVVTEDGGRGVIVNTASVAAFDGQIGQTAYSASKGAVVGMTLPMARDLANLGIRVVSIAPGLFHTPMVDGLPDNVRASLGAQVPFPSRLGNPQEFAKLALHIVENDMLNGETIRLDGAIRIPPR